VSAFDRMPLNSLRVFEAVATALSFSEAAEALNVTPAAVSMQIKSLEDYLQVSLFRRNARSIELTAEGAQLLPAVRRALDELRLAVQRLRADRSAGPLNVSMLASFLQRWFVARLPGFSQGNPDIDLRIHTSGSLVDFAASDFHGAIRYGRGDWPALASVKLFDDWLLPVGSPALVKKLGRLESVQDLSRYTLLHSDSEPWTLWTRIGASRDVAERGVALDDSAAILSAAEHGQGLALARWSLVASDIGAGRLVPAATFCIPHARSYFFVCPENYLTLPKVALFHDWLMEESQRFEGPVGLLELRR
jgi:LysR family transcriptional regulator, glycine cleavage system transcriptional activator